MILYRDERIVAVAKPAGIFVHRSALGPDRDVLLTRVRDLIGQRVHPLHRLDRATSGVVLFALDADAAARFQAALATAHKEYLGVVRGVLPEAGVWDRPLSHPKTKAPQEAVTEFERLAVVAEAHSLARFRLRTGRYHQIRRHLNHAGHHLVGDSTHGKGWLNRWFQVHHGLPRMALHALRLGLVDPDDGARLDFVAPVPADLRGFLTGLPGVSPGLIERLE